MLARKDVDGDSKDDNGRTPLSWAAWNEHNAVVKQLQLHEDVDVNSKDIYGETPLSWAARNGHDVVVQLLES
jgi:ankyrin repeat protein